MSVDIYGDRGQTRLARVRGQYRVIYQYPILLRIWPGLDASPSAAASPEPPVFITLQKQRLKQPHQRVEPSKTSSLCPMLCIHLSLSVSLSISTCS